MRTDVGGWQSQVRIGIYAIQLKTLLLNLSVMWRLKATNLSNLHLLGEFIQIMNGRYILSTVLCKDMSQNVAQLFHQMFIGI